ncbi:hypothetical protein Prudu_1468S000400, partial [Prunus dulcis]
MGLLMNCPLTSSKRPTTLHMSWSYPTLIQLCCVGAATYPIMWLCSFVSDLQSQQTMENLSGSAQCLVLFPRDDSPSFR